MKVYHIHMLCYKIVDFILASSVVIPVFRTELYTEESSLSDLVKSMIPYNYVSQ